MNVSDAIDQACSAVGISPPKGGYRSGQWAKCDTLAGKNGKGDGRIIVDDMRVTAHNWQTGQNATVWMKDEKSLTPKDRRMVARQIEQEKAQRRAREERAAKAAARLVNAALPSTHPYLARKGFPAEKVLVLDAPTIRKLVGDYLIAGEQAIVMPARIGLRVTSVQLIWEDGTKKFLSGGSVGGSSYRISTGRETWLCEGLATGLSLRAVLKSLNRSASVLCCFSASNVATVAKSIDGQCFVAADHDKPQEQFAGLGTGEHWARQTRKPFFMPPEIGDINDLHQSVGVFALQKLVSAFIREARM